MKEYIVTIKTDNESIAKLAKRVLESLVISLAVKRENAYVSVAEIEEMEITSEHV